MLRYNVINIPNFLTVLRILLIIPFVLLLCKNGFTESVLAFLIFCLASLTDYFDGFFARYWKETSKFGRFMDPLADKLLIASAFISFLVMEEGMIPVWMVVLVLLREFLITALRVSALSMVKEVSTSYWGKLKAVIQFVTIIFILLMMTVKAYICDYSFTTLDCVGLRVDQFFGAHYDGTLISYIMYAPVFLMTLTTIITVGSGLYYLYGNRQFLRINDNGK